MNRGLIVGFLICSFFCHGQEKEALKPKAISKLLPEKIERYTLSSDSRSSMMKIGTLRYSLCERVFSKRDQKIKILLFDYVEAPIMLTQSVKKWNDMPDVKTIQSPLQNAKTHLAMHGSHRIHAFNGLKL